MGDFIKTEEQSKRILTLPIHQYLKESDIFKISQIINNFLKNMNKNLNKIYSKMIRIRMIEQKIASMYAEQEMRCPVHLSIGQEAVATGVCSQLKTNDIVLSAHRAHAHYLAKGGDLKKCFLNFYGKENGCYGKRWLDAFS